MVGDSQSYRVLEAFELGNMPLGRSSWRKRNGMEIFTKPMRLDASGNSPYFLA